MPASLFADMECNDRALQDQRTLELALELSMFGLNNENEPLSGNGADFIESRNKKSQNTTECVPVPSSEHVAEIVGRQGCKIKALRAKTNTYIKTPVRGEEPVFVVTGRKEDVAAAKREILSAAEHFSQIRAQRKSNLNGSQLPGPNSNIPGQTTIQVRVPYRVVGLVVGPKGATIKRIQQQTSTYIVTPSRDKEPIFEVTGLPDSVETARKEIEAHIAMRTGSLIDSATEDCDFGSAILDSAFANNLNAVNLFKNSDMEFNPFNTRDSNNLFDMSEDPSHLFNFAAPPMNRNKSQDPFGTSTFGGSFANNGFGLYDVDEGLGESPTFDVPQPSLTTSSWPDFGSSSLTDSIFSNGIGGSRSAFSSDLNQRSNSISGALADFVLREHPPARRIQSDPEVCSGVVELDGVPSSTAPNVLPSFSPLIGPTGLLSYSDSGRSTSGCLSSSSSPTECLAPGSRPKRDCMICFESPVVAALVPCGHNLFCFECATRLCDKEASECPLCHQPVAQAIRIFT